MCAKYLPVSYVKIFFFLFQKENIKTIPNMLTLGRILSTPLIGYLVVHQSFTWALGLFVCAGITDMVIY